MNQGLADPEEEFKKSEHGAITMQFKELTQMKKKSEIKKEM